MPSHPLAVAGCRLSALSVFFGLSLAVSVLDIPAAAAQIDPVSWTHLSSASGDLPVPPASTGQSGLKVVDLDKNGQNDYVITFWDGAENMVWYRHLGDSFEKYIIDTDKTNLSHGEKFTDIDGDGDIDLVIGDASKGNTINWWENPYPVYEPNTPWVRRVVYTSTANFFHDNIVGDFDADGSDEMIAWNQNALQLLMFEIPADPKNAGSWPATPIFTWSAGNRRYRGADAADINQDGKIDFVGGCGWFEHTGGTNFVRHQIDERNNRGYSQVKAGQLIAGGRPEVVCLLERKSGPLNMYEWTGTAWVTHTLLADVPRSHTLQLGDVNQDGNLDIMYGELGQWSKIGSPPDNPNAKVSILYGDGSGNFTEQVVFTGQGHLEGQLADIDNDGDLDIVTKPFLHNSPFAEIWLNQGSGPPQPDTTPPAISNIQVNVTDTTATVTWNTNEAADSVVDYGLDAGYGSNSGSATAVLSHSVTLTGLTPETLYHYRVSSSDNSGNTASSADLTFNTIASGAGSLSGMESDLFDNGALNTGVWTFVDPVGNSTVAVAGGQASISVPAGNKHDIWKNLNTAARIRQAANNTDFQLEVKFDSAVNTRIQSQGLVVEQDNDNLIRFDFYNDGSVTRVFSASFTGGLPNTRIKTAITDGVPLYLRVVRAGDLWTQSYSYDGANWIEAGSYTHALGVTSVGVFAGNAAGNPAHTALVDYFMVDNLQPPGGGDTTPPVISNVQATVTDTTATISWNTNETADSMVDYGPTSGYGSTAGNATLVTNHSVTLTGLSPGMLYHYQASSSDSSGNSASGVDLTFTTSSGGGGGSPSGLASDQFDGGVLDTGVWTFVDPLGDSSVAVSGGQASISVPAGTRHEIWKNANRAPRIRQAANDTDFQLEAKFDSAINSRIQMQGLVVEQDDANLIRFDFYHDGSVTRVHSTSFVGGQQTVRVRSVITDGVPLYLRVVRVGDQWTQSYSYDGANWIDTSSYTHALSVTSVGVFAGNSGNNPAHTALIDYFMVDGNP